MTQDRREHARYDLVAQVKIARRSQEIFLLATENISRGGAFLAGIPEELPELAIGSVVDLTIFVADDLDTELTCAAQVMRVERSRGRSGFGVKFLRLDAKTTAALQRFIDSAED